MEKTIKSIKTNAFFIELAETTNGYKVIYSNSDSINTIDNIKDLNMALTMFEYRLITLQTH